MFGEGKISNIRLQLVNENSGIEGDPTVGCEEGPKTL